MNRLPDFQAALNGSLRIVLISREFGVHEKPKHRDRRLLSIPARSNSAAFSSTCWMSASFFRFWDSRIVPIPSRQAIQAGC